jgi:hypothetical protein
MLIERAHPVDSALKAQGSRGGDGLMRRAQVQITRL